MSGFSMERPQRQVKAGLKAPPLRLKPGQQMLFKGSDGARYDRAYYEVVCAYRLVHDPGNWVYAMRDRRWLRPTKHNPGAVHYAPIRYDRVAMDGPVGDIRYASLFLRNDEFMRKRFQFAVLASNDEFPQTEKFFRADGTQALDCWDALFATYDEAAVACDLLLDHSADPIGHVVYVEV